MMKNILSILLCLSFAAHAGQSYEPTVESLKRHEMPEWLLDGKFGIWTHWTPVTYAIKDATEQMGWYAGNMYIDGSVEQEHHLKHYGPIKEVGYGDLCRQFDPVKFDADEWADLFARSGARFAGPTAIHCDNFAMWDSDLTPWNAVDMGPKRDIVGELGEAIREREMKYLMSYHHAFTWFYHRDALKYEEATPENILLFGEERPKDIPETHKAPISFHERWLALAKEANTKYKPDIIWHDFGLHKNLIKEYRYRFLADYYNMGKEANLEVEALIRDNELTGQNVAMDTMEKGVRGYLDPVPWNKNTSASQEWFAFSPKNGVELLPLEEVVHDLVDTVSKNGTYILNVGPNADGSIRPEYKNLLIEVGDWLKINGEAIYNTRPWLVYGEFPRGIPEWRFVGNVVPSYDSRDIRYTRSKDGSKVYAIALGWPKVERLTLQATKVNKASTDAQVRLLGVDEPIPFEVNEAGNLVLDLASIDRTKPGGSLPAYSFELSGFKLGTSDQVERYSPNAIGLHPEEASFAGWGLRVQPDPRGMVISRWVSPEEAAYWHMNIRKGGKYEVVMRYSMRHEKGFPLQFVTGDQILDYTVEHTGADAIIEVSLGTVEVPRGFQELVLRMAPEIRPSYHHLKIFGITLVPAD